MPYHFLENVAIADVAFEATGRTIEEMFISAGKALTVSMVKDLGSVIPTKIIKIKLSTENPEKLLFDFLQELIFLKDAKLLLFSEYELAISEKDKLWTLAGVLKGEKLDMKKHELLADVKAVSWHRFSIQKNSGNEWEAFVILDV